MVGDVFGAAVGLQRTGEIILATIRMIIYIGFFLRNEIAVHQSLAHAGDDVALLRTVLVRARGGGAVGCIDLLLRITILFHSGKGLLVAAEVEPLLLRSVLLHGEGIGQSYLLLRIVVVVGMHRNLEGLVCRQSLADFFGKQSVAVPAACPLQVELYPIVWLAQFCQVGSEYLSLLLRADGVLPTVVTLHRDAEPGTTIAFVCRLHDGKPFVLRIGIVTWLVFLVELPQAVAAVHQVGSYFLADSRHQEVALHIAPYSFLIVWTVVPDEHIVHLTLQTFSDECIKLASVGRHVVGNRVAHALLAQYHLAVVYESELLGWTGCCTGSDAEMSPLAYFQLASMAIVSAVYTHDDLLLFGITQSDAQSFGTFFVFLAEEIGSFCPFVQIDPAIEGVGSGGFSILVLVELQGIPAGTHPALSIQGKHTLATLIFVESYAIFQGSMIAWGAVAQMAVAIGLDT